MAGSRGLNWSWITRAVTVPTGSHSSPEQYLVLSPATGAFAGEENNIAVLMEDATTERWAFVTPQDQQIIQDQYSDCLWQFDGSAGVWTKLTDIQYKHGVNISSLASSWTVIPFDTLARDDDDQYEDDTGSNAGEVKILRPGWFRVDYAAQVSWVSGNGVGVDLRLEIDIGSGFNDAGKEYWASTGMAYSSWCVSAGASRSAMIHLDADDKIRLAYRKTPGASAGTGLLVEDRYHFHITNLGTQPA